MSRRLKAIKHQWSTLDLAAWMWAGLWVLVWLGAAGAEEPQDAALGERIYEEKCARCHGPQGEGTAENYPKPLAGTKSLAELAEFIDQSMPEDDPEACVGQDARLVAKYIYDEFYSVIAQTRRAPPRLQLSRLTVNQYRQVVADLVASFQSAPRWDQERGLSGEYFDGRGFRGDKRKLRRVDAMVNFQFGETSPLPGELSNEEFSIRWQGGIWAPQTGTYEFLVETDNAIRLYLNDLRVPLIDAWVRSGNETTHRSSIFLIGGRVYPIRLEFMKFKENTARVQLFWKVPDHTATPITPDYLSPHFYPPIFVVTTPFPPDDRSMGYERGTSVSREWQQAAMAAALETATYVAQNIDRLAGTTAGAADRVEKLKVFCRRFLERAFRRPLTPQEETLFVEQSFTQESDGNSAVKRCVLLGLQSPRFLYHELATDGQYNLPFLRAARLSFALWDSIPDEPLWQAAAEGRLNSPQDVAPHVERMLSDLRARAKMQQFLHQWLKLDHMNDIAKAADLFPDFGPQLVSDLRYSLDLFLDDVLWGTPPDLRRLLLESYIYATPRMAAFYGWDMPSDGATAEKPFVRLELDPNHCAGVLTHPMLMSGFAYTAASSPIHRGVFLARSVLGKFLRPPPEAVAPLAPDLHPNLTTRARVELQTSPVACQSCHALINPLGFALENYDAVGRYRLVENGQPINAAGQYRQPNGQVVHFTGARELATYLASSPEVAKAMVDQLFHFMVKQPIRAFGVYQLDELADAFQQNQWNMRWLISEIATRYAVAEVYLPVPKVAPADSGSASTGKSP